MSMTINFGRVGMYNEDFPSINSPDRLITWPCKSTETILAALPPLPQGLWPLNFAKW